MGLVWLRYRVPRSNGVQPRSKGKDAGWVYFIGGSQGPIKVGFTRKEPTAERLPELQTLSPYPLRVMHSFRAVNARMAEAEIHDQLARYREHGEWFDREAALSYISHLKGEF